MIIAATASFALYGRDIISIRSGRLPHQSSRRKARIAYPDSSAPTLSQTSYITKASHVSLLNRPLSRRIVFDQSVRVYARECIPSSRKSGFRQSPWLSQLNQMSAISLWKRIQGVSCAQQSWLSGFGLGLAAQFAWHRRLRVDHSSRNLYDLPTASSKAFCCARNIFNGRVVIKPGGQGRCCSWFGEVGHRLLCLSTNSWLNQPPE